MRKAGERGFEEARRLYGRKPVFVVISPHLFRDGGPWEFVDAELYGQVIDELARENIEGIGEWTEESIEHRKSYDPAWPFVAVRNARIGPDNRYLAATRESGQDRSQPGSRGR